MKAASMNGHMIEGRTGRRSRDDRAFVQFPIDASLLKPIVWVILIAVVLSMALFITNHFGVFYSRIIQDELSHLQSEAQGSYKAETARRDLRQLRLAMETDINKLRLTVIAQEERIQSLERTLDSVIELEQDDTDGENRR